MSSNVLPLRLKQTFPPIIWIFTEGEEIESRLPFKIFSTLKRYNIAHCCILSISGVALLIWSKKKIEF